MRTLFGLVPFYGGDDGPMDQMVKATLASVRPDAIDVRNEAGDTLLILACQHGCEVRLVETYRLNTPVRKRRSVRVFLSVVFTNVKRWFLSCGLYETT